MTDTDPTKTTAKKAAPKKAGTDEPTTSGPPADDQDATVGTAPAKQPTADEADKQKPEA